MILKAENRDILILLPAVIQCDRIITQCYFLDKFTPNQVIVANPPTNNTIFLGTI